MLHSRLSNRSGTGRHRQARSRRPQPFQSAHPRSVSSSTHSVPGCAPSPSVVCRASSGDEVVNQFDPDVQRTEQRVDPLDESGAPRADEVLPEDLAGRSPLLVSSTLVCCSPTAPKTPAPAGGTESSPVRACLQELLALGPIVGALALDLHVLCRRHQPGSGSHSRGHQARQHTVSGGDPAARVLGPYLRSDPVSADYTDLARLQHSPHTHYEADCSPDRRHSEHLAPACVGADMCFCASLLD